MQSSARGPRPLTVAIDGPSGSGKSSVSRAVARRLGLAYLDTGAMYRALAWWCLRAEVDLADVEEVARRSRILPLRMSTDPDHPQVHVGEDDVTAEIRTTGVSTVVSQVATNLAVRADMRQRQRDLIAAARDEGGIVVEGRDITTVVAPDAEVRILLSASEEARLARRARELYAADDETAVAATRDQVLRRDRDDATVSAFFDPADGVVGIDTSSLTFEESVAAVLAAVDLDPGSRVHT
ncbi:(d)CMP kinase [Ornithinicoccus halotolerans]|uniref:(d)CMP kinase n=1 Tax=Ornithinicoccus halotolerans TaxID=1748220 RepID=UPI001E36EDC2|nr:(d)CMP kinase [Ornithinicoccus halotolerans]